MHHTKQWLKTAQQLCGSLGPKDGFDPRYPGRTKNRKTKHHKNGQFLHILIGNNSASENEETLILGILHAVQSYLRAEIARSVKRKQVPGFKFQPVHV